jgi:L-cystine transport system substrate-binding protein
MGAVTRRESVFLMVITAVIVLFLSGCGSSGSHSSARADATSGIKTYVVATRGTAKPFSYTDDQGNLTGYDVEILKEVEKRDPSIHFIFKTMAVDAAFVAMDSGQVDIIANQMRHTPARDAKYSFTKEINNYTVRKLVVKKGRTDIHSLEDLKGKKVMVTTNSEMNTLVKEFNKTADPPIQVVYTDKGSAESLNMVATGRVDASGEYVYVTEAAEKTLGLPIQITGPVLNVFDTHYLLRKAPELQEAADRIDRAIASMRSDGTLKKLSEQYLGDDYTVKPKA